MKVYDASGVLQVATAAGGTGTVTTSGSPVDNDIAKFTAATVIEGRSYAELKADLNLEIGTDILAEQTIGIADDNLLEVDGSPNSEEYARFTANGLEGRTEAEFKVDFNLEIGTDVQAYDAELAAIAGLTSAANKLPYFTGLGAASLADLTAFARTILDDADEATFKATVNLEIGTDVLAYDVGLSNLAGVAMVANRFYYTSADNVHVAAAVTAFARSILDDADEATFKATVNLEIGTDVLAEQTIGIADNNLLEVDDAGPAAAGQYARFTANGLEGRTEAEFKGDFNLEIGTDVLAEQTIGIADDNLVEVDGPAAGAPASGEYARWTANGIEGRQKSEVLTDLNVEDGANVTDATNVDAAGAVMEGDYGAYSMLAADTIDVPQSIALAVSQMIGRKSTGGIVALAKADVLTIINVTELADVTGSNAPQAHEASHVKGGSDDIDAALDARAIALANQGEIVYLSGTANTLAALGVGTAGQALLTGGAAANPSWGAPAPATHAASHTDGTDDIQESSTAQKGICQLDDTPVNGETNEPITSNWAFDHAALGTAHQSNVITLTFIIDGGGSAITTGEKGHLEIPFACTIIQVTALADQSGSIVVDIWKDTYANFPPDNADSITASAPVTISTTTKSQDSTLTGWTTAITAGDILAFNVDSITTCERVTISIRCTKT